MKRIQKVLALPTCILLLTGCSPVTESSLSQMPVNTDVSTNATTSLSTTAPKETTPASNGAINPLTGEANYNVAAVGKRPVAVMVNNIVNALPQYGIAAADIIYEMPVEAGITRLMAVYADYTAVPNVCSIRSCRYYYPILANGMDAIYCHWGADQTIATETLKRLNIDHLDGGGNGSNVCFFRDEERKKNYATEHTGYLDGSKLSTAIAKNNFRTDTTASPQFAFRASKEPVGSGVACNQIVLPFSNAYWSTFSYDTTAKAYKKQHNDKPHMDSVAGKQLAFTNVFALQTTIAPRADGYLMDVALSGGDGWYFTAGTAQQIRWEKKSDAEPITVYDLSGAKLQVNPGKSYIGLIDTHCNIAMNP